MSNIFEKFNKSVDLDNLKKDIKDAEENGGNYKEVPHGYYEVSIDKLELKETKEAKSPMVTIWFNVVTGDYKGSKIFMNQVITLGFQIHIVNELLRKLVEQCDDAPVIEFVDYLQYAELLMDVSECIQENFEYALKYSKNKSGFDTFEITDVFPLE